MAAIQREIDKRGWTRNELARQLDVESGVVSRLMTRKRGPGAVLALKLQRLLGIEVVNLKVRRAADKSEPQRESTEPRS